MGIFGDLLAKGYLPVQLAPAFSSSTFASELSQFEAAWGSGKPSATLPGKYSVARSSFYRRHTALVNPIGFYFLAKEVANYWPQIEKHYQKSSPSRSVPTFAEPLRAIRLNKFSELYEDKITSAAGFKYAPITDITSFFPTIYTHAIPWALHPGDSTGILTRWGDFKNGKRLRSGWNPRMMMLSIPAKMTVHSG